MSKGELKKTKNKEQRHYMEIRQDKTIRLKYVDDTTLAVKLQLDKLFELKEAMEIGSSIPEYFFDEKTPRELTEFQMSDDRNPLHEMIDDVAKFVHLNQMKINTKKSKTKGSQQQQTNAS